MNNQEEVLEKFFKTKGYTNYFQADFFLKLANAIQEKNQSKNLKKTFPKPRKDNSSEFQCAFSLIHNYLEKNEMELTMQYLNSNVGDIPPTKVEELNEQLSLEDNRDPLKELIHDYKAKHLLDPQTVDIKLSKEYLD